MQRLEWAALLLVAVLPPPAVAQQLPMGPLKLPGPENAIAGTAASAAAQGQLGSKFAEAVQPVEPATEPGAAAGGRRSAQGAAVAAWQAAGAAVSTQPPASSVLPGQRSLQQEAALEVASSVAQLAEPLFLPGPGQRLSSTTTRQQAAAGGSPAVEPSRAAVSQGGNAPQNFAGATQLVVPAAEPTAAVGRRRSVQVAQLPASVLPGPHREAAIAAPGSQPAQPSPGSAAVKGRIGPISRSLGEGQHQMAGPLTLPGPSQRVSSQIVNQQVAARGSPSAERATAPDSQEAPVQGRNTRLLLMEAAAPLPETLELLPPEEATAPAPEATTASAPAGEAAAAAATAAAAAAPAAEQPASPFALVLPTVPVKAAPAAEAFPAISQPHAAEAGAAVAQPPAAEAAEEVEHPPAAEAAAAPEAAVAQPPAAEASAAPEEQTPFEPIFPGVPPAELAAAPAAEALPPEAVTEPTTTAVPELGSEAALLEQAELALSGPTGNASVPAFPAAGGSTGALPGTPAGAEAQLQPGQPPPGTPGSNFSNLISLLDPPASFQMPPLSPQQQENLPKLKQLRQGTGTVSVWRNVGNFGGTQMACGMGFLSDYFKDHFVALPTTLYRSGELCGGCVRLWCVDSVCQDALVRNASFMVTDSCKDCTGNSLLVSERGFTNLTGININISPTLQIAWTFESCAPLISGGIRMLASKNNGPTFLSCNFSNLRQLLKTVTIGGIPFTRTAYGAWELNSPGRDIAIPKTGAELVLTSVDGQRISKRLRTLGSQDLGINFN